MNTWFRRVAVLFSALAAAVLLAAPAGAAQLTRKSQLSLKAGICLNRAQALFSKGEIREAIAALEPFVCPPGQAKGCSHPCLFFTLGNFYAALAEDDARESREYRARAVRNYNAALQRDPEFCEAWLNLAAVCHSRGDFGQAALAFEKGYQYDETPKAVHLFYAAVCQFQAQNSPKALELFAMLQQHHPDQITLAWKEVLVHILFSLDRQREALPHIEALANTPWPEGSGNRQKKWQEILINQYLGLDMDDRAVSYAKMLTRSDPMEPLWWKALTHLHLKGNHLEKGLSSLIVYGFLTPMTPEEKLLAADIFLSLNIPGRAADLYEALLGDPGEKGKKGPLKKMIQALAMAHDRETAVRWIDKALGDMRLKQGLSSKEIRELETLKDQLVQIRNFYAAAAPVLCPGSDVVYPLRRTP